MASKVFVLMLIGCSTVVCFGQIEPAFVVRTSQKLLFRPVSEPQMFHINPLRPARIDKNGFRLAQPDKGTHTGGFRVVGSYSKRLNAWVVGFSDPNSLSSFHIDDHRLDRVPNNLQRRATLSIAIGDNLTETKKSVYVRWIEDENVR